MRRPWLLPAIALVMVSCSDGGTDGTLQAVIDDAGETTGFANFSTGGDKSFGVFICAEGGAVELQSVEPAHAEGDVEFLGALVYTSDDMFVGAAHGYPPDGIAADRTEALEGAVVDTDCSSPEGADRVQLLVGAERTGAGGGVIDGVTVETSGGTLEIPLTILLCGDRMEFCEVLVPPDDE